LFSMRTHIYQYEDAQYIYSSYEDIHGRGDLIIVEYEDTYMTL
jgi:hypothetical protein